MSRTAHAAADQATRQAQGVLSAEELSATATAVAPIFEELARLGIDPSQGRAGWVHHRASLDIQGYHQYEYVNQFLTVLAGDMVVSSDITWNTTTGLSGCGFVLRSMAISRASTSTWSSPHAAPTAMSAW